MTTPRSLTTSLLTHVQQTIDAQGGWIGFDTYMNLALYTPGLGYYARGKAIFGSLPAGTTGEGSDFVTAPELSPYFGRALAAQVLQALDITRTHDVWEFGAGTGALALQLLDALGDRVKTYTIVDLSGSLQAMQRQTLSAHLGKVRWLSSLPAAFEGVVVGNEVLDAMPVRLVVRAGGAWHERGVSLDISASDFKLVWQDRPADRVPPLDFDAPDGYLTELHEQAEAFVRTLGEGLQRGAVFLMDYGFPQAEYYHAQRHMGTVMCHRAHLSDTNPLADVGLKDITAHVNFTGIALAAQEIDGFGVLGYTSQARFLMNCGLLQLLESASISDRAMAQKLVMEHEMGELFKVIGLYKGDPWDALGFSAGDRTHRL